MLKPVVLIIDDDRDVVACLSLLLEKNFEVLVASSGSQGLALFDRHCLSVILLDLFMPGMNGLETLRMIREKSSDVNVVIVSGSTRHDWTVKCTNLNIQGYFQKPFDPTQLIKKLKSLSGLSSLMKHGVLKELWGAGFEKRIKAIGLAVKEALNYIEFNCKKNITRETIAAHLALSPDYLSRLFQRECGIRLMEYVTLCRMHHSRERLSRHPRMKVKEIASSVGISDVDYFCRLFKKHSGLTPKDFRKKLAS